MLYESEYYGIVHMDDIIEHHGIKGQKWGIRRFQNPDGSLTEEGKKRYSTKDILKNAKTYNLDSWGKDPDHNILYVTGFSGSGKSTAAENLGDKNTDVVHLDIYIEPWMDSEETGIYECKALNKFLDKKGVPYKKLRDGSFNDETGKPYNNKQWWKTIDQLQEGIEAFGKSQYNKKRRVVVEGVAMNDETMYEDKSFFKGKPLAIMKTGAIKSTYRAAKRDLGEDFRLSDIPKEISIAYRKRAIDRKQLSSLGKNAKRS